MKVKHRKFRNIPRDTASSKRQSGGVRGKSRTWYFLRPRLKESKIWTSDSNIMLMLQHGYRMCKWATVYQQMSYNSLVWCFSAVARTDFPSGWGRVTAGSAQDHSVFPLNTQNCVFVTRLRLILQSRLWQQNQVFEATKCFLSLKLTWPLLDLFCTNRKNFKIKT